MVLVVVVADEPVELLALTHTLTHPQRAIDELSLMEAATADPRPAYLLEQLPEMREALCRGVVWAKVAKGARETVLNDSQAAECLIGPVRHR